MTNSFVFAYENNFPIGKTAVTDVHGPGLQLQLDFTAQICTSAVTITGSLESRSCHMQHLGHGETLFSNGLG